LTIDQFISVLDATGQAVLAKAKAIGIMPPLPIRFYEQKFPEVDDVVMVKVRSIAEMGAYVTLSE
jgi:hypothetical protein